MTTLRSSYFQCCVALAFLVALGLASVPNGIAETPNEAIRRIQAGQHSQMPPAITAPASGPAGKGMTIENGTGHVLHIHFSGPMSRTVVVADGRSESVELAVGDYQIAAEAPSSEITPFYGRQTYRPRTHYWLKFHTQRIDTAGRPDVAATSQEHSKQVLQSDLSSQSWELHAESMHRANDFWNVQLRLKNHHTRPARFSTQHGDPESFELTCESVTGEKTSARPFGFIFQGEVKLNAYKLAM